MRAGVSEEFQNTQEELQNIISAVADEQLNVIPTNGSRKSNIRRWYQSSSLRQWKY